MERIKSGVTILHNNATNSTFIADELDEKVQTGTRENDQHIEWMGELDVPVEPCSEKLKSQINKLEHKVELLEDCRRYDANGKNRPDGYIVCNVHTAGKIDEMNN